MFAPEGYLSWNDINQHAAHWSTTLIYTQIYRRRGENVERAFGKNLGHPPFVAMVDTNLAKSLLDALFRFELLQTWMLANFMAEYETLMCSPTGTILKAPKPIFLHADKLDWCGWSWEIDGGPYLRQYFDLFEKRTFWPRDIDARFPALDTSTGIISLKNNTAELLQSAMNTPDSSSDPWLRLVRAFVGWAVCWNSATLPKTFQELFDSFGLEEAQLRSRLITSK